MPRPTTRGEKDCPGLDFTEAELPAADTARRVRAAAGRRNLRKGLAPRQVPDLRRQRAAPRHQPDARWPPAVDDGVRESCGRDRLSDHPRRWGRVALPRHREDGPRLLGGARRFSHHPGMGGAADLRVNTLLRPIPPAPRPPPRPKKNNHLLINCFFFFFFFFISSSDEI